MAQCSNSNEAEIGHMCQQVLFGAGEGYSLEGKQARPFLHEDAGEEIAYYSDQQVDSQSGENALGGNETFGKYEAHHAG